VRVAISGYVSSKGELTPPMPRYLACLDQFVEVRVG